MKIVYGFLIALIVLSSASCKKDKPAPATAHTVNIQPSSTDGQDTYVSKIDNVATDGNANVDFANELVMGRWTAQVGGVATQRAYLKFSGLSAIPANATVSSARLYLYGKSSSQTYPNGNSTFPGSPNGDNTSVIQRVTGGDWNETTLTWNTMPSSTNVGEVNIPASNSQWNYNVNIDVTAIVKEMVAHPTTNFGFVMKLVNETPSRSLIFATSEASDPALRPKLVVEATY